MRRGIAIALAAVALSWGAWASSYDEFSRGLNAVNRGNADLAIASFSTALAARDLPPTYIPSAYLGRAMSYLQKGRCSDALADLDEVLKIDPDNLQALLDRASANACLKNVDAAVADGRAAAAQRPSAYSYETLGRFLWQIGKFSDAAQAFAQDVKYARNHSVIGAFAVLWFTMSTERAAPDQLASEQASGFDCGDWNGLDLVPTCRDWPGPLLDFYRGKIDQDDVYTRLKLDPLGGFVDDYVKAGRTCEADFYIGEWDLVHKRNEPAKALLLKAMGECAHETVEFQAAGAEAQWHSWSVGGP